MTREPYAEPAPTGSAVRAPGPDAVALAAAVRNGETDTRTLTEEAIGRIEALNPGWAP
ncbi:hypothetical protein NKH18_46165 [Streptomyces sp. M10(2022)]